MSLRQPGEGGAVLQTSLQEGLSKSELGLGLGDGKKAGTVNSCTADQVSRRILAMKRIADFQRMSGRQVCN